MFGALSYAGLTALGVSPKTLLLMMLIVPAAMAATYVYNFSFAFLTPDNIWDIFKLNMPLTQGGALGQTLYIFVKKIFLNFAINSTEITSDLRPQVNIFIILLDFLTNHP